MTTSTPEIDPATRDRQRVRNSFRNFALSLVLAGVGVAPWIAGDLLTPGGKDGEYQKLSWAWLFWVGGAPLVIIAGVFYVTSLVYGILVIRRRPVVWWWFIASVLILIGWAVFALTVLDQEDSLG